MKVHMLFDLYYEYLWPQGRRWEGGEGGKGKIRALIIQVSPLHSSNKLLYLFVVQNVLNPERNILEA